MKHKKIIFLGLIVLYVSIGIAIRAFYLEQFAQSPLLETPKGADVEEYCAWAKEIIAGRILWPYVKIHAPLYPFFLAFLYSIFSTIPNTFFYIRLTQILVGFLACLPLAGVIVLIKREKSKSNLIEKKDGDFNNYTIRNVIIFLVIWGIYPPLIYYLGELTSEVLLIPLLSYAVYLLYKGDILTDNAPLFRRVKSTPKQETNSDTKNEEISDELKAIDKKSESTIPINKKEKKSYIYLGVAGICSGLACIAHPLALFFLFSEIIYLFLRKNILGMLVFAFLAFLMISPVTIYNMAVLKEAIPIQANGGFNLYLGNNESSDGTCKLRPGPEWDAFHLGADYTSRQLGISKDSLLIQKTAIFIIKNPLKWLKLVGQKSLLVWNHKEITAGADLFPLRYFTSFQRYSSFSFGICAILALTAIFANWTNWSFYRHYRHIIILILAFWLSQSLLVTSGRYRIAMVPCMLILTSWTIGNTIPFIKAKKGNIIRLSLALLAAAVIVYVPQAPFNLNKEIGEADTILGEAYLINQNYKEAEKHLLSAREKSPGYSRNYNLLGLLSEKQNKMDLALQYYLRAKKCDPSAPDAFMNIALLFSKKEDYQEADDFFKKAFSLKTTSSANLYYNYGLFCYNKGERSKAFKNYIKCIKIDPSHEMALNNLGIIFFIAGKYPEAEIYFQRVIQLEPRNSKRMINLASAKFALGKNEEALNIISKALEITPHLPGAHELKNKIIKRGKL